MKVCNALQAVALMMDWLMAHQNNPYPNDDEKEMLMRHTRLSINQINYWFTNARRRILPKWSVQRYTDQSSSAHSNSADMSRGLYMAALGGSDSDHAHMLASHR